MCDLRRGFVLCAGVMECQINIDAIPRLQYIELAKDIPPTAVFKGRAQRFLKEVFLSKIKIP